MVNPVVYDYLRNYAGKYKFEDIKNKVLSGGYSEQDFNEAASALGLIKKFSASNRVNAFDPVKQKKSPVKMIKASAVIGVFFVLVLILILAGLFFLNPILNFIENNPGYFDISKLNNKIIYSFIFTLFLILLVLFYTGFYRIGKIIGSRQFKIFSLIMILFILLSGGFFVFNILNNELASEGFSSYLESNQNYFLGVLALFLVVFFLFNTGLILIKKSIRYSFISGVLGIVFILDIIVFIALLFSLPNLREEILNLKDLGIQFAIVPACFCFLLILIFLFKTLLLFSALKKFSSD